LTAPPAGRRQPPRPPRLPQQQQRTATATTTTTTTTTATTGRADRAGGPPPCLDVTTLSPDVGSREPWPWPTSLWVRLGPPQSPCGRTSRLGSGGR